MKLVQAAQAPFVLDVEYADKQRKSLQVAIPFFTLGDFIAWGQIVDQSHIDASTKGMNPEQRYQFMTFYGPMPSNLYKLKSLCQTPDGIKHVLSTQLPKAAVIQEGDEKVGRPLTDKEILELMRFPADLLQALVTKLTDLPEESKPKPPPKEGQTESPLSSSNETESKASSETGASTSLSSTPLTPEATPAPLPSEGSFAG